MRRILYGGGGGMWLLKPGEVVQSYMTVRYGRAARIAPEAGEVAVRFWPGGPDDFAGWVVGTPAEVAEWLVARAEKWLEEMPAAYGDVFARDSWKLSTVRWANRATELVEQAAEVVPGTQPGPLVARWRKVSALADALGHTDSTTPSTLAKLLAEHQHLPRAATRAIRRLCAWWQEAGRYAPAELAPLVLA